MSCKVLDILPRDGTNQLDRIMETLGFEYVQIEERTPKEWLDFAKVMSSQINFYELNDIDLPFGTWEHFFTYNIEDFEKWYQLKTTTQDLPAHLTLFIAFLKLLELLKDDLNKLTKRHLDFYYKGILGFKHKNAIADKVHLLVELATNVEQYRIEKGTLFKAGKDNSGKELVYRLDREAVLNQAKVKSVKTVYRDKIDQSRIYAAPVANSEDGLGRGINKEGLQWSPFGEKQLELASYEKTMVETPIGFAIASPILLLKEGTRIITIVLELTSFRLTTTAVNQLVSTTSIPNDMVLELERLVDIDFKSETKFENIVRKRLDPLQAALGLTYSQYNSYILSILDEVFNHPLRHIDTSKIIFAIKASGEKNWIDIKDISLSDINERFLRIVLTVGESIDPIVNYNSDNLSDQLDTIFPILKILFKSDQSNFFYDPIKYLKIVSVNLHVSVVGVRDLILQNDNGLLSPNGKFLPFGPHPVVNSSLLIGNYEIFSKKLDTLSFDIDWLGKPNDLLTHYLSPYLQTSPQRSENSFSVTPAILDDGVWSTPMTPQQLFNGGTNTGTINITPTNFDRDYEMPSFEFYNSSLKRGFVKLDLNEPDFGHTEFPKIFTDNILGGSATVPYQPYTPEAKILTASYSSQLTINFGEDNYPDEFFHIEPIGSRKVDSTITNYLVPQIAEGTLYIGVEDLQPLQSLSLLFKIAEGSADPEIEIKKQDINWNVLSNNIWLPLTSLDIFSDTTEGIQTSGILNVQISENASIEHTLLPSGLKWLRATIDKNPAGTAKIELLQAQAVETIWKDQENDSDHLQQPLQPESIRKLVNTVNEIKKIKQPFTSFGGKMAEQDPSFYARVSERLRHKQRLVTLYDTEHLVLEAFSEIYKCKSIPHYFQDYSIKPGQSTVVVIPNLRNKNAIDLLKPRVSSAVRNKILEYLLQYTSPWVELAVLNPLYETIQFDFSVRFHQGFDAGFYANELNEELIRFLSPWAFEEGEDIIFGGKVYKSIVLDHIEELEYVNFVTNFILVHNRPGIGHECIGSTLIIGPEVDVVSATTPRSILVSSPQHKIHILEPDEEICNQTVVSGIGTMMIESSFGVD